MPSISFNCSVGDIACRMQLHVANSDDEMVRMVEGGGAQLGINSLIMSSERLDATDFTGATWQFRSVHS